MSIEELIQEGSIHPFEATHGEIDKALKIARRDLALAEGLLEERAYMFYLGYRPASTEAHKATFEFMQIVIEEPFRKSISYFDRARKKRHRTLYGEVGVISETEAEQLLNRAREFLSYIESKLKQE